MIGVIQEQGGDQFEAVFKGAGEAGEEVESIQRFEQNLQIWPLDSDVCTAHAQGTFGVCKQLRAAESDCE